MYFATLLMKVNTFVSFVHRESLSVALLPVLPLVSYIAKIMKQSYG